MQFNHHFYCCRSYIPLVILPLFNNIGSELKDDSFLIGIITVVVLTTELDAWFTTVQKTSDCSAQVHWVWAIYVGTDDCCLFHSDGDPWYTGAWYGRR